MQYPVDKSVSAGGSQPGNGGERNNYDEKGKQFSKNS